MLQGERRLLCAAVWAACIRGALIYQQGCQFDCGATPCTAETVFDANTCCIQIIVHFGHVQTLLCQCLAHSTTNPDLTRHVQTRLLSMNHE